MKSYAIICLGLAMIYENKLPFDIFNPILAPPIKITKPINWRTTQNKYDAQKYFHDSANKRFYPHGGKGSKKRDNNYIKPKQKYLKETKSQRDSKFEKILRNKKVFKTNFIH